jgi:nucleoside-diphosphate-sugar epimerase
MQTILGAGGAIGIELARALRTYTNDIRLVSRNPRAVNPGDQLFPADLTKSKAVSNAVEGSKIVYLTVGLPYNKKVWQSSWPILMRNVIDACRLHESKLVFFDNVYMYDPNYLDRMTEETPINPGSKKGMIRADIASMLSSAVDKGHIQALIARSADFYGPSIQNTSVLTEMVFKNLSNGKKANWLGSVNYKHSFTYTPDAGRATALLGNTPDACNQVWHLPTAKDPLTGKEWIEAISKEMKVEPKYQVAPKFLVRLLGIFVPLMKELTEMMYQYDRDYIFDSSKFEGQFKVKPTSYPEGIKEIVKKDYGDQLSTNRPKVS